MIPSLEGWPTKAKEATSPYEVQLTLLDTNPLFQCLREKYINVSGKSMSIFQCFYLFDNKNHWTTKYQFLLVSIGSIYKNRSSLVIPVWNTVSILTKWLCNSSNIFKSKECKDTNKPTFTYLRNGFKQLALNYYNTLKIKVTKKLWKC